MAGQITIVLGTRPEIIKFSPIIRALDHAKIPYVILHTGQHYSYDMDRVFFERLQLPEPKYNLDVGSGSHAEQTGRMLIGVERILRSENPEIVLVEGDTNTVLAGALAARKLGLKVGHVEAGLRSGDSEMPEEMNRILTDHISEYLFAPTATSKSNLIREGLDESRIYVTGNTIVDAVEQNISLAKGLHELDTLGLSNKGYIVATIHRQENVDREDVLRKILDGLKMVSADVGLPIAFCVHPRTRSRIKKFGLEIPQEIRPLEPLDYLSFLNLEAGAKLVLTDSGGVQEEACILKIPCVTLRENTERPETVEVGANVVAGREPARVLAASIAMIEKVPDWTNPFGDGKAGRRIVEIVTNHG